MSSSLSDALAACSAFELQTALDDRYRQPVAARELQNHYSQHAMARVLLIACAFDARLNESVWILGKRGIVSNGWANCLASHRYRTLWSALRGQPDGNKELEWAFEVRDELAHWKPFMR